ncbi:hypothetical protein BC832DRAFT_620081 [Gaertneriomyces semiglobifer]|nr:hypothetical protein BC832DRAFT_620081 [Gaertneriomyces semiglobifer]
MGRLAFPFVCKNTTIKVVNASMPRPTNPAPFVRFLKMTAPPKVHNLKPPTPPPLTIPHKPPPPPQLPTPFVRSLLDRNHREHHIYFGEGLHNHFPHTMLSLFALGAPQARLVKEYDLEDRYLVKLNQPSTVIDATNWTKYIGDRNLYSSYLQFFDQQVEQLGIVPAMLEYALKPVMIPSLLSGLLHPLIHLGYGLEFESPMVVAEALSQASTHPPRPKKVLDMIFAVDQGSVQGLIPTTASSDATQLVPLFNEIYKDDRLDKLVRFQDSDRSSTTTHKCAGIITEYASRWYIDSNADSLAHALRALFYVTTVIYGSGGLRPGHPQSSKFDFFLLHLVTSTFACLHVVPHLPIDTAIYLLRSQLAMCIHQYIARGRPPLQPVLLISYPLAGNRGLDTWEQVMQLAITSEDLHVPKIVRSLHVAETMYGSEEGLWLQAARFTVDHMVNEKRDWDFTGCGWDEAWNP